MVGIEYETVTRIQSRGQDCFCNNSTGPGMMVSQHWHDAYELLYVRRGEGRQWINADTMTFGAGDLVLIRPGDVHATEATSSDGCDIDVVQFAADCAEDGSYAMRRLPPGVMRCESAAMRQILDALRHEGTREAVLPGQDMIESGLVRALCGWLVRISWDREETAPSGVIREVCVYLDTASSLQLQDTAQHFGYSAEHLSRKFHREMGIAYRRYCDMLRMRRAASILNRRDTSVSAAAEQLGYRDAGTFVRAFRRVYGITPHAYVNLVSVRQDGTGEISFCKKCKKGVDKV